MELLHKDFLLGQFLARQWKSTGSLACGFLEALYQEAFEHELKSANRFYPARSRTASLTKTLFCAILIFRT